MNNCYCTRTAYHRFHMPLQILHKQFSRQCLCKGLVKGQKSQGSVLTKARISPSIKLSTKLNLYSTLEPCFSANIRQHVRCVGRDKSATKAHMSRLLTWPPMPGVAAQTCWKSSQSAHHRVHLLLCADSRVQNVASENNDSKTSKGPNCLLNA